MTSCVQAASSIRALLIFKVCHIFHIFTEHGRNQFYARQICNCKFTYKLTISQNCNLVTNLVNLFKEVSNKDDSYPTALKVTHKCEQKLYFIFIKRRSWFVKDKNFTIHINSTCNCNHLLNCKGTSSKLLSWFCRNIQLCKKCSCLFFLSTAIYKFVISAPYIHILCNRKIRAEGNFLINCSDAKILGILWRTNSSRTFVTFDSDFTCILFVNAGNNLNQG